MNNNNQQDEQNRKFNPNDPDQKNPGSPDRDRTQDPNKSGDHSKGGQQGNPPKH